MTQPNSTQDCIVTFQSSHLALKAEQKLAQSQMSCRLISAPRVISSQCGFCLLIENQSSQAVFEALDSLSVAYSNLYSKQPRQGVNHYEKYR